MKHGYRRLRWGEYLAVRGNWSLTRVAVALDTKEGRQAVQAALPLRILNAWTQPGDLGVSRHGFLDGPCLMCLYLPDGKVANEDEIIGRAIGLSNVTEGRGLLHGGQPIDAALLERIAAAKNIDIEKLMPFAGLPLRTFYGKAVCGTALFGTPSGGDRGSMAVPMAFQSALAGILLAGEIVADAICLRGTTMPTTTKVDLLRPLPGRITVPMAKHASGRCICQDPTYIRAFRSKYCGGEDELIDR